MNIALKLGAALAVVIVLGCNDEPDFATVGQLCPDKAVESLATPGKSVSPRDFKGKVVLLDFWATWCGPCKQFMPTLQSIYTKYHDQGLEVMSISGEARLQVETFHKKSPYTFPVYLDQFGVMQKVFQIDAIPRIAVIDRNGTVVYDGGADPRAVAAIVQKSLS